MNQDNRNFVLFAVIAVVLLFGWPWVMQSIFPQPPAPTKIEKKAQVAAGPSVTPASAAPGKLRERPAVLASTPRVRIETPELKGSINLKGAQIDDQRREADA